ncbi:hypothetical protein BDR04DRAFT_1146702 [Suillus decipiens]|nr:hypothetical protein BDR04DRAFT_1146702 [Suillus decipiens]
MEEMALLEDKEDARKLAATLLAGIELARLDRIETHNPRQLYLCRAQLLPDPHCNTPWQLLYESQNDCAFITTMGIDTQTFELILTSSFASQWYQKPITNHYSFLNFPKVPKPSAKTNPNPIEIPTSTSIVELPDEDEEVFYDAIR